jgi:hypothetical protein
MNETTIENGKTEIGPAEFEFEAARRALDNLVQTLEVLRFDHEASAVSSILRDLAGVRAHFYEPM